MAKPRLTRELMFERTVPECPHCRADMDGAAVTLWDIVDAATEDGSGTWRLRIDGYVPVDTAGYADAGKASVVADCPSCSCPSVLVLDGLSVKLVAARTPLDRRFLEAQKGPQP